MHQDLTARKGRITVEPTFNRIPPVLQRSIIVELSPVAGLAATRFGMIIGAGTTTTMPTRAGTG